MQNRTLVIGDFLTGNVTLNRDLKGDSVGRADQDGFVKIGEYTVPASEMIAIGLLPEQKGGLFYINLLDASSAVIHGQALIKATNPERTRIRKIVAQNTRALDATNKTNRLTQPLVTIGLSYSPTIWVIEDSKIELWFRPETNNATIDSTKNNELLLECLMTRMPDSLKRR